MNLEYNVKTEVTLNQFRELKKNADGICAFRIEGEKYFIKLLFPKYKKHVEEIISQC